MPEIHYLVPLQAEGLEKDVTQSLAADSAESAEDLFVDAKERLLDVNNWKKYSAMPCIVFQLTDSHGQPIKRRARKGDHICLDIPGNGIVISEGFDWVGIEAIEYDDYPDLNMETFAIRVRPCFNPLQKSETYHTPSPFDATSTFVIERRGRMLFSTYHGRNEFEEGESNMGYAHNTAMVAPSAWLGLTDVQCVALISGFIR